jgi:CubicO group peptidase (beta-lactamase class C family)
MIEQRIGRALSNLRPAPRDGAMHPPTSLRERMAVHQVPGVSIALINDYRLEWAAGFGVREAGAPAEVDTVTLFQACSISKAVTAAAVLVLAQEGRLDLDADIHHALRSWQLPAAGPTRPTVTVRQLLSHSGGVNLPWSAGYHPNQEIPTLLELLNGERPSNYPAIRVETLPGLRFRYSGGGYCILQQLLIDLTGRPFPELMREIVLEPFGMKHSSFEQPLPPAEASAATGHRQGGTPVAGKWRVYPEMALGGLWSTPSDLARFALGLQSALAGRSAQPLSGEWVREMLAPRVRVDDRSAMGLGLFLEGSGVGARFGHPGDNEGFASFWQSLVESGRGVVIMTNSDAGWRLQEEIVRAVAAEYDWPEPGESRLPPSVSGAVAERGLSRPCA